MSGRTKLRDDFDAGAVRAIAKGSKDDAAQTRRLLALASIYDGGRIWARHGSKA